MAKHGSGRGQDDFEGDFRAVFAEAMRARAQGNTQRKSPPPPDTHMRPFIIGWSMRGETGIVAMGRDVIVATSEGSCKDRAYRVIAARSHRNMAKAAFEIRYIKETK